jgi:hypothetical protein
MLVSRNRIGVVLHKKYFSKAWEIEPFLNRSAKGAKM